MTGASIQDDGSISVLGEGSIDGVIGADGRRKSVHFPDMDPMNSAQSKGNNGSILDNIKALEEKVSDYKSNNSN